ncbi:hypothetical protein EPN28_00035 [Patescibacteria group bacterium]|nr:MAG: hypothetical protein EPN28_00035 [Patescibacteria group bacterium]
MCSTKRKNCIESLPVLAAAAFFLANFALFVPVRPIFAKNTELLADNSQNIMAKLGPAAPLVTVAEPKPDRVVRAVITAYTSSVEETDSDPFTAASGKKVYDGMLAANWLPFGTKIKIPSLYGDKVFTVHDRMNARYGYGRLDIWLNTSRAEARKFGVKRVAVEVYYLEKKLAENK